MDENRLKALKVMLFGRSLKETIDVLCQEIGTDVVTIEAFRAFQDPYIYKHLPNAPLLPGAARLVYHLAIHNVPIAVATSAPKCYFDIKTKKYRTLFETFGVIVTADDVTACKPAPDLFLKAAKRLHRHPNECLVLEDAPSGIQAAKAAGMTAIAIPPANTDHSLYEDADAIYPSLEALPLAKWGLPRLPPLEQLKKQGTAV
jgi:HAD superfamily hydrolase (TIGR01509 family)